ncbi:MAG: DUF6531 domain-containing protein [Streptomyces sp.]|uniref:DUF6531 domain-containing protein n=1 Tax=Streptomyces sp. TaxID=1931 RepID=UPI003D6A8D3E
MGYTIPEGVDTMLDIVGVGWPNVDEDAYRDMADALREFAEDADDDGHAAHQHIQRLVSSGNSEALTALNGHWSKVKGKHKDLAKAARIVAGALDRVAEIIVARKIAAVAELADLVATVGIALAAAPLTMGLTSLLAGAKIVATRLAFKRILKEMAEAAVEEIVATLTEPAVKALENMVADLAIGVASDALGVNGGNGGQGGPGKDGMQLASAGGGAGGGAGKGKLHIDHGEHDNAGTKLAGVQISMSTRSGSKLSKAKGHHGRAKGKDSLTAVLDTTIEGVTEKLTKGLKELGEHVGETLPKGIKKISDDHKTNEQKTRDSFNKIQAGDGKDGRGGGPRGGANGGRDRNSPHMKPNSTREAKNDPGAVSRSEPNRVCKTDPVDVATGEMILTQTDLALPGVLPLVLRRTHVSSYRYGQWFGPSWASTLDERLELDPRGATWTREDGSLLIYPGLPREGGEAVWPLEGDRLPLAWTGQTSLGDTTYTVTDPHSGLSRHFTGNPYQGGSLYWLTGIQDRNGNGIDITRGENGLPTTVTHDGGYSVRVTSDTDLGRVTGISLRTPDGLVRVMSYGYDPAGNLDAVTNSSDTPLRFTYDDQRRITSWTDRNDSTYSYIYDTAGRVAETVGPEGYLSSRFTYDTENGVTYYTDSTGAVTTLQLNDLRQVIAETDPLGNTVRQEWDRYDNPLSRTDALGHTTRLDWDETGNLITVHLPDGTTSTATYNSLNLPEELTGPDGTVWCQTWDERGNNTAVTAPDGSVTRSTRDATGAISSVIDATGATQQLTNDAVGLPLTTIDPLGRTSSVTRDAFGRPSVVTDRLGTTTYLEWTTEGLIRRRTTPDGNSQTWTWDGESNCLTYTDANDGTTTMEYTHFDQLAARTTADGMRYEFGYDTELRLTCVLNPQGLTWRYAYDRAGHLASETDFDDRTQQYEHNPAGRLATRTTSLGQEIRYTYDALGRPVTKIADGTTTSYVYDRSGRLIAASSPTSDLTLERDVMGRLLAESVDGRTTTYAYDLAGRRTSRTTPTGAVTNLIYDETGNRAQLSVHGHLLDFSHDALGREIERAFGTVTQSVTLTTAWDTVGRQTEQSLATQARTLRSRSYSYRPDNHLTSVTDQLTGHTRQFELDSVGRPLTVTAENWTETYAYDAAGNQTTAEWPDRARNTEARGERTYTGTQLLTAGAVRYEHDAAGRMVLRQKRRLSKKPDTWRYTWDAEDRLTFCTTPDGATWSYLYDPLGRRTAKRRLTTAGDVAQELLFIWDDTRLAEQVDTGTNIVLTWDHDGHRPLTQTERRLDPQDQSEIDSRFFAIVTDLVGTPTELVDETGDIAWHTRTTLWGTTNHNRDATAHTPLRFPGQYADPETGLHYNYFRHYDPDTARYASPDPLGLTPAPNPTTYVTNPHTNTDPLGLSPCSDVEYGAPNRGRPSGAIALIGPSHQQGTKAQRRIKPPGFGGEPAGHSRGHLIPKQLGGDGRDERNLVTQDAQVNNGPQSDFEDEVSAYVHGGHEVLYVATPHYSGNDPIPSRVDIDVYGDDGWYMGASFMNRSTT